MSKKQNAVIEKCSMKLKKLRNQKSSSIVERLLIIINIMAMIRMTDTLIEYFLMIEMKYRSIAIEMIKLINSRSCNMHIAIKMYA